ncbi:MAG: hypothetical protein K6L81_00925, partial [Agarilytica sp.]
MSHDVADKALAGYFDDLLADEAAVEETEVVEVTDTPISTSEARASDVEGEPQELVDEAPSATATPETDDKQEITDPECTAERDTSPQDIQALPKDVPPTHINRPQTLQEKAEDALRSLPE